MLMTASVGVGIAATALAFDPCLGAANLSACEQGRSQGRNWRAPLSTADDYRFGYSAGREEWLQQQEWRLELDTLDKLNGIDPVTQQPLEAEPFD